MTLTQMLGQKLVFGFHGTSLSPEFKALIRKYKIGNVILFLRNVESADPPSPTTITLTSCDCDTRQRKVSVTRLRMGRSLFGIAMSEDMIGSLSIPSSTLSSWISRPRSRSMASLSDHVQIFLCSFWNP